MGLRNRLWLVMGALVVLPLLVGGLVAVHLIAQATESQVQGVLRADAFAVSESLSTQCEQAALAARSLGAEAASGDPATATQALVNAHYIDYAAVLGGQGSLIATAGTTSVPPSELGSCSAGKPSAGMLAERVEIQSPEQGGPAVALVAIDLARSLEQFTEALPGRTPSVALALDGTIVASTGARDPLERLLKPALANKTAGRGVEVDGWLVGKSDPRPAVPYTVVAAGTSQNSSEIQQSVLSGVLLVAVLALVLGWDLSRQLTNPLVELTAAAERVASGDLDQTLPVRRDDETGRLAASFNRMTRELRRSMTALARSRDDLRTSLERLGGALGSTHDVERLMKVVLDTAVATSGAQLGAAWVKEQAGPLQLVATHGPEHEVPDRLVAGHGATLLADASGTGAVQRAPGRAAIPLLRGDSVVGLIALEWLDEGRALDASAEESLRTLARQAGIAIENVIMHREAQRLSITDPLTGLWNFRYLSMSLSREIERASRFGRPLAVLMLDVDHFKKVNDTYGHARGDAVLREIAARVSEQIREVDTFARYGGEEFTLVLPETSLDGGSNLAERICAGVRRVPFGEPGEELIPVTVSVGVAGYPYHGASAATLLRAADGALYVAKNSGRDRWHAAET